MSLIENTYEQAGLLALPPHARDVAEHLLTFKPLNELLALLQVNEPNEALLSSNKVPVSYWQPIIKAAILAKTTYFIINPDFTKEEIHYLLKAACNSANMPLNVYTLAEVIEMSGKNMSILRQWLILFATQLKQITQIEKPKNVIS